MHPCPGRCTVRTRYYDLLIDGKPILVPDADVQIECTDLDSPESGRDESGWLHRLVQRRQVKSWHLTYSVLTAEEYRYMESLFAGKDTFPLDYRDRNGEPARCEAYRSKHSITLRSAKTGIFRNYNFHIIEC